jgi:hypothetical protein
MQLPVILNIAASYVTLPRIYVVGFLASMIKSLFDHAFRGSSIKVGEDQKDISFIIYIVMAILWPIMTIFGAYLRVIGLKRFRKFFDAAVERAGGTKPTWTLPPEVSEVKVDPSTPPPPPLL